MSRVFRARIPPDLEHQLTDFCARWHVSPSAAIRLGLRYLLGHEDEVRAALAPPEREPLADTRTPEQQAAWVDYEVSLGAIDIGQIIREAVGEGL